MKNERGVISTNLMNINTSLMHIKRIIEIFGKLYTYNFDDAKRIEQSLKRHKPLIHMRRKII